MQVSILGEGKYELNEKEKSAFAKAKEFLIDLFSYIPKDASDEFIAHQIRLIWDKNYAVGEDGDFFADLNDDIRLSVRANPSPEEIAEAKRQKEEVKAKWTNPDGSMKKGYMLTPNGKPTKLTEDQWLLVRTPNFKRWFGDWETLAEYEFLNGKSIRDISTKSVPSGGFAAIREWAAKIFERQGGVAKNSILGDVILDKASVRDSLAHGGANLYKSAAFEVAKDVIEKGYLIFNDVNKGRDSYYFAAPINIDGVPNIVVALVHKRENGNHFYLHSVGTKESLLGNRVSGMSKVKPSAPSTTYPRDYLQALQNIFNVKPKDVSKVVDENGEPLVVYHGTDNTNTDYTNFTVFKHSDPRVKKYVHFFSSN